MEHVRKYVINIICCLMVVVFALYTISIPVRAAGENALSFQMHRIRTYNSDGSASYYLSEVTASGGNSGVQSFGWGGFAISLDSTYTCWQAGGVYNIASPSLITITLSFRDDNNNFNNDNLILTTDKPSWKEAPSSSDFPNPYAGTGLCFWSGYSCGAYQIDTSHNGAWYDIVLHFAVNPPETYGMPYQDMFTLNICFYSVGVVNFATTGTLVSYTCIDTTTAVVDALNSISNISNPSAADQAKMDDFGQTSGEQAGQISSATAGANDFSKPSGDDIAGNANDYVSSDDVSTFSSVLSIFTQWPMVTTMMLTVFSIATVAYVLFGKR